MSESNEPQVHEFKGPLKEVEPSKTTAGSGSGSGGSGGGSGSGSSAGGSGSPTGTRDKHYDLVSVLYHATQGAWNYDQYISDAQDEGDDELAQFFRDVSKENAARAKRAKELLQTRLSS